MLNLFLVFIGGGFGTLCRYAIAIYSDKQKASPFIAYLVINTLACFVFGLLYKANFMVNNKLTYNIVFIGFLGGFGTYTSYLYQFFNTNNQLEAIFNIIAPQILGLLVMYIGFIISQKIFS